MSEGDVETRTYEVTTKTGEFRITVPSDTRVTFGPVLGTGGRAVHDDGNSLRFWRGKDTQLALFLQVVAFRDTSLPLAVRAVSKYGSEGWVIDNGSWVGDRADEVERGWISFDDIHEPATSSADPSSIVTDVGRHMLMKPRTVKIGDL